MDFLNKKRVANNGIVPQYYLENSHPAIVSTEMFDMVQEELAGKLARIPDDARQKVQETLGRMVNEGDAGMICILL